MADANQIHRAALTAIAKAGEVACHRASFATTMNFGMIVEAGLMAAHGPPEARRHNNRKAQELLRELLTKHELAGLQLAAEERVTKLKSTGT